ncbi:hypothetical protein DFH29DRAFT_652860 [Suillus ampliporus]|nr:hypothetical protein DFH29DRAFT_652860 [Suillus ampliporus]
MLPLGRAVLAFYASSRTTIAITINSGEGVTHNASIYEGFTLLHFTFADFDLTDYQIKNMLINPHGHSFVTTA